MRGRPIAQRAAPPRILAVVVVFAAATVIYQQAIPVNRTVRARLSQLVVTQPGVAGYKEPATTANEIPSSSNPFAAVTAAAKTTPTRTGAYAREWTSSTSTYGFTEVLASWLPTTTSARTTMSQALTAYAGKSSYTSDNFAYHAALTTKSLPGSQGATYQEKATKTSPALTLAVTVFRLGLVVVVVNTVGTNLTQTQNGTTGLAQVEAAHLTATEPGFTLTQTTRPPLATAIFAAATAATAAAAVFSLEMVRRARRRRQLRRAAQARRHVGARGQRIIKNQRSPTR